MTRQGETTEPVVIAESSPPPVVEAASAGEPEILTRSRREAWRAFQQSPLPVRSQHLWRYSDPRAFLPEDGDLAAAPPARSHPAVRGGEAGLFLFGEGGGKAELSPEAQEAGVVLVSLRDGVRRHEDLVGSVFDALIPPAHGKLEALAATVWRSGAFLHVPRNVELTAPIRFLVPSDGVGALDGFRYALSLGDGARLTLIEEHVAAPGTEPARDRSVLLGLGELAVGRGAKLEHVIIQRLPESVRGHMTYRTRLSADARHAPFMVALGGKQTKIDFGTLLSGPGAETELRGVLFGAGRQLFDHHTLHDHVSPHTRSNLEMRTVLADRALSAYTGLIRIGTQAPHSEAYQENRNLVLSEQAKAESIPELEIETDEVQCKHGATVGSVDEEQIYYLMSRGIPRTAATRIIVRGFVDAILDKAPADLKESLEETVRERLLHIA